MQTLKRIARPEEIADPIGGKVILQDREGHIDCAKYRDDQHAIHIKWRKVPDG
jgi:hypothetical protein